MSGDISIKVTPPPPITIKVQPGGAPGPSGKSAYELAVAQGFDGAVDEWLASLKGEDGTAGPTAVSADADNAAVLGSDNLIFVPPTTGGASNWGDLDGTLSDQADLQAALDTKANIADLGSAATASTSDFATAAQGAKADTAVQPGALAPVATSNQYSDLYGKPTIPSSPSDIGAAPAGAYVKPVGGIPTSDLDSVVQAKLSAASTAYQKPGTGVARADLDASTQASLGKADSALQSAPVTSVAGKTGAVTLTASDVGAAPSGAYVKPGTGIPKTDLETAVQTSLGKADTALQSAPVTSVAGKTGAVTLTASDVGASPSGAYVKPGTGIPKTDLETAVQSSLGKADTALQSAPVTSVAGKTGAVTLGPSDVGAAPAAAAVPSGGTTGQVLTKNSGTNYDATWVTPSTGTGGTTPTADYAKTTASLANNATETGTWAPSSAQVHEVYKVTVDKAARVRFYDSTAHQTADASRAVGTDPTGDHGLLLEAVLPVGGNLYATVAVPARIFEQSAFGAVPYSITNLSGSTGTVTLTLRAKGLV